MPTRRRFDPEDARRLQAAYRAVSRIPMHAPPQALFDALARCLPIAGGALALLRPGVLDALTIHGVRLPEGAVDAWMTAPVALLEQVSARVLLAGPGELQRDTDLVDGALPADLDLRDLLGARALGEAASFKVLQRSAPEQGTEHVVLVLCTARGTALPLQSAALLAELHPAVEAAVLRMELPLIARDPILAQLVAEQTLGYICLSPGGLVLESNRRAHDLATRYDATGGLVGRRQWLSDLAHRARERCAAGGSWRVARHDGGAVLQIHVHRLAREFHALHEDVLLVSMREWSAPPDPDNADPVVRALAGLSPRKRQICLLLAREALSYKEIADTLGVSEGTIRKHAEQIYRELGVHSRAELARLLR
ncbi:MAG: LuxR C-terminal-related transcriptional regulator [Minicystis sp.]